MYLHWEDFVCLSSVEQRPGSYPYQIKYGYLLDTGDSFNIRNKKIVPYEERVLLLTCKTLTHPTHPHNPHIG